MTEVLPTYSPLTSPSLPDTLLTCAIELLAEVQLTSVVQSSLVPSLKLQVALSCTVVPLANGWVGVSAIEVKLGAVTVTSVGPPTLPNVAVSVATPGPTENSRPLEELLMLTMRATLRFEEVQSTSVSTRLPGREARISS